MFWFRYPSDSSANYEWCIGPAAEFGGPLIFTVRHQNLIMLNMLKNSQVISYRYIGVADQWYHITFIYSEDNGFEHYINGNYGAGTFVGVWNSQPYNLSQSFLIGRNYLGTTPAKCDLDELYVWYEVKDLDFISYFYNL